MYINRRKYSISGCYKNVNRGTIVIGGRRHVSSGFYCVDDSAGHAEGTDDYIKGVL